MASSYPPVKNVAFTLGFYIFKNDGTLIANPGGLTSAVHTDFNTTEVTNSTLAVVDSTTGLCSIVLAQAVMNGDQISGWVKSTDSGACAFSFTILTSAQNLDTVATNVAAIKVPTDKLVFTVANQVDSNVITKTGFSLSATGADLILKSSTFAQALVAAINELATYGLTALNTLLVTTGIKTASTAAPADMALNSTVAKDATVSKPATAQTITAPADMALNSTVAKATDLSDLHGDLVAVGGIVVDLHNTDLPTVASAIAALPTDADVNAACDTAISDANIPVAVWASATRSLTTFGTLVADIVAAVWSAAVRVLTAGTNLVFSTHSAADVAALVLVTPANKLETDISGHVTYSNTAPPSAVDIKTALEVDGSKLDHLWETTEDDAGIRRFTTNALEQAPVSGSAPMSGSAPTVQQIRVEMDSNSTQLAAIIAAISGLGLGTGPIAHPYIVSVDGIGCADVLVVMTTDLAGNVAIHSGRTNALGTIIFYPDLPAGTTVYLWRYKTGINWSNPDAEVI